MLSLLTFLFTSLLITFAAAQNTTFDPDSVALTLRNTWCLGEKTNCPLLCGGQSQTTANTCVGSTNTYTCTCANGTGPSDIAQYLNTWPNYLCNAEFAQCRIDNPGSQACVTCGTLQATNVPAVSSTSSAAATSSTATATTTAASTTASVKSGSGKIEVVGGVIGGAIGLAAVLL